jgi:hypothetical protein
MLILSQTEDLSGYHGAIGTPSNMCDSNGNPLFIGDIVTMFHKDYPDKSIGFVCEENHKYAHWTNTEYQYVFGIASIWNSETFKQVTATIYDDTILEEIDNISQGWIVKKVKDFAELVVGEHWDFLYVREI